MAFTAPQTNSNQHNNGIIGDGSDNFVNLGNNTQFVNNLNSNNHVVNNNKFINNQSNVLPVKDELDTLLLGYVSEDALPDYANSPPECHPGTCKTVRNQIKRWIDHHTSPLLWLNGPVGVGKSVIAKTIAVSHKQVVASFFFFPSSNKSATTLFPTLAWQLARRIPETKQHMIDSLTKSGCLLTSEIDKQFDLLIVQPLKKCKITATSPHVMIIDGVDECTDENMLSRFLRALVRTGESGNMPLRFIICSRPEPRIHVILKIRDHDREIRQPPLVPSLQRRSLSKFPLPDIKAVMWVFRNTTLLLQEVQNLYWPVQLGGDQGGQTPEIRDNVTAKLDRISFHPVVSTIQIGISEECKEDVAKYLTDKFNEIPQPGGSAGAWFEQSNISNLVQKSCGQFIYASTVVRLLDEYYSSNPSEVLEMARNCSLPTPDLNMLYKAILERAKDSIRAQAQGDAFDYETELRMLMDTLATVIVFAENVTFFDIRKSFPVIQSLLTLEEGQLMTKLRKMHSVLNIVRRESITVYHRSFLEFFQSEKRSGEYHMPYPKALRRFLVLLGLAGLRYAFMDWCGQLKDDDRKIGGYVKNIALAYRRNYFKRSSSPKTLIAIHYLIHLIFPLLFLVPFTSRLREFPFGIPTYSSTYLAILQYLLLTFFCLFIFSSGSFIISLTIYTFFFNHSLILPLFYPFLHPHFVITVEVLLFSGQGDVGSPSELDGEQGTMAPVPTEDTSSAGITIDNTLSNEFWDNVLVPDGSPPHSGANSPSVSTGSSTSTSRKGSPVYRVKATALYTYKGSEDDPHELTFTKGDEFDILDRSGKWWQAETKDGRVGIVPSNYVRIVEQ